LQATALYAAISNGGNLIEPSLIHDRQFKKPEKIISSKTSYKLSNILRKVVTSKNGTASLADKNGYYVGGKTGTAESYGDEKNRINTFISIFPTNKPNILYCNVRKSQN
jgi:cell division protein FtsI (penicillin-binding protein 3)